MHFNYFNAYFNAICSSTFIIECSQCSNQLSQFFISRPIWVSAFHHKTVSVCISTISVCISMVFVSAFIIERSHCSNQLSQSSFQGQFVSVHFLIKLSQYAFQLSQCLFQCYLWQCIHHRTISVLKSIISGLLSMPVVSVHSL